MSDADKIFRALGLFNEKAEKLMRLSFIKAMLDNSGVTLSWRAREDGLFEERHERRGPNEEAIDAFILTFRFFIQDNEQSSFHKMAEHYLAAPIDESLKSAFATTRKNINEFLDESSDFPIEYNGRRLTRREVMDIFVYGGLAHANQAKKELYDSWMSIPPFRPVIENEFVYTLAIILDAINYIKGLNEITLGQMRAPQA